MKKHHLSVTTLEEYEPNHEFIGRNFNNGEVIQLVLRRKDGSWMSFRQVQMVMMHELAHNVQMNHGKAFWVERNRFAAEMKALWERGYSGEGFWGSGTSLQSLQRHAGNMANIGDGGDVEGLCGGAFRSTARKRKRGNRDGRGSLTWREQRDKKIEKKFGRNGVALGEDEDARIKLEIGRRGPLGGKPRVAGSKRGRELRAAAALARFEVKVDEEDWKNDKVENGQGSGTEEEDGFVADEVGIASGKAATDVDGNKLLDSMGFGMVKVGDDEDIDAVNVKKEIEDFDTLDGQVSQQQRKPQLSPRQADASSKTTKSTAHTPQIHIPNGSTISQVDPERTALYRIPQHPASPSPRPSLHPKDPLTAAQPPPPVNPIFDRQPTFTLPRTTNSTKTAISCLICTTLNNDPLNITCKTCAHVLDRRKDSRAWKCGSGACQRSEYLNAGDCGRCGVCGARKLEEKDSLDGSWAGECG